jgi:hypothetical protein
MKTKPAIRLLPPRAYPGGIKPLCGHTGRPICCTPLPEDEPKRKEDHDDDEDQPCLYQVRG